MIEDIRKTLLFSEPHSIQVQLDDLVFKDCFYRTHNDGLRFRFKRKPGDPSFFLQEFHDNYVLRQAVGFRRVFENYAKDKDKRVYSILSTIAEMKKNHQTFSLKNYLEFPIVGYESKPVPPWLSERTETMRRKHFVLLSGKPKPTANDTIDFAFIEKVEKYIKEKKTRLEYHLNKYWLHSSTPGTQLPSSKEPPLLSLKYLDNLLETAIWASKTLGHFFDVTILSVMPVFTYDPLIGLEFAFDPAEIKHCRTFFEKRKKHYGILSDLYSDRNRLYYTPKKFLTL